jgi:hypothetical protein
MAAVFFLVLKRSVDGAESISALFMNAIQRGVITLQLGGSSDRGPDGYYLCEFRPA